MSSKKVKVDINDEAKGLAIHMLGVCGVGMAGLAALLKGKGHVVSGCDLQTNELTDWLKAEGVSVIEGHDPSHITGELDLVIRSRAVPDESEEVARARELGIPVMFRGEVLPKLLDGRTSVAVSGTHGKTSTSAFIAQILISAGQDPSWFVGSECDALSGVAHLSSGEQIVVEADESDGTAALYEPDIAVVTNIDFDHMEHFHDEDEFKDCFRRFIGNAKKCVICCGDNEAAREDASSVRRTGSPSEGVKCVFYGTGADCSLRAIDLCEEAGAQSFKVERDGEFLGDATIPMRGQHNVLNALATSAVCLELGLGFDEIVEGLASLTLPSRRYELAADVGGIKVISDYAHHPAEIRALIQMAEKPVGGRLVAVFQPHRYTRTLALGKDYPAAFAGVDEVVLCPVYAASEKPIKGGTIYDLYAKWAEAGQDQKVLLADDLQQAWGYLKKELQTGDVLLVIGAGDVDGIARWAGEELGAKGISNSKPPVSSFQQNEPLGRKTTWGVGGTADLWAEVEDEKQLRELFVWSKDNGLPLKVLGAGSNVLVSDLGVRGVVARLGAGFREIEKTEDRGQKTEDRGQETEDRGQRTEDRGQETEDRGLGTEGSGHEVVVGAGVTVAKLSAWLEEQGFAGLEFLEGVPGMMGGILKMNAGAAGGEIGECVSWIRCLKSDGNVAIFRRKELEWEYRGCPTIRDHIVVEAGLHFDQGNADDIRENRSRISDQRSRMKGLRSAGSVFRNPGGISGLQATDYGLQDGENAESRTAGQLIDEAGLKGLRVGGARVYEGHGNFIVTEDGATASDVRALIEIVRAEVFASFGVKLEEEIKYI